MSKKDHSNNDCLLVAVMSHGSKDGKIHAADYKYPVQELWEKFLGDNCRSLMGKPKLFFIQACRGGMIDPGALVPKNQDSVKTDGNFVIPYLSDLLVMYSTSQGFFAFRNSRLGTVFIQALCEEFKNNSKKDLMKILTGVNRRVAYGNQIYKKLDVVQMSNIVSMLTKTMFFPRKT